jgi:hypothetical protein
MVSYGSPRAEAILQVQVVLTITEFHRNRKTFRAEWTPAPKKFRGVVGGLIAFTDRERLRYAGPVLALPSVRRRVP